MRKLWGIMFALYLFLILPFPALAAEPEVHLFAGEPERKSASFSVGEEHSWYIRCSIPQQWENIQSFHLIQTLSPGLSLREDSILVTLIRKDGSSQPLEPGLQCETASGTVHVEKGISDRLSISLTEEGIRYLESQQNIGELMIEYRAKINEKAEIGIQILGSAQLNLTDTAGKRTIYLSDRAAVTTGGIHLRLSDPAGKPIEDGKFMLARRAAPHEIEDTSLNKEILDTGEETVAVIYMEFFDEAGNRTDLAVTDSRGNAALYGIAYGTYYLVQTESAGEGLFPSKPVQVTVNEVSHLTGEDGWTDSRGNVADNTVRILNTVLVMPQTGGPGTLPYTAAGMLLLFCAGMLLWYNRKRTI